MARRQTVNSVDHSRKPPGGSLDTYVQALVVDEVARVVTKTRLVSQDSSEQLISIEGRRYLRDVVPAYERAGGKVARVGRLRLCDLDELVAFLLARSAPPVAPTKPDTRTDLERELGIEVGS